MKAMKTQAWGWLFAGVLAAGLNATYHDGGLQWAHQAVEGAAHRSAAVLALASGHADQFFSEARIITSGRGTASCRFATAVAVLNSKIARTQSAEARLAQLQIFPAQEQFDQFDRFRAISDRESARREAQMDRLEAARARMEAQIEAQAARIHVATVAFRPIKFNPVVCPRVRVNVPRVPMVRIPAPVVHVELPGTGPV
jgi:hypothetical protein